MNTEQTETIASVNRFLKIERINRFLQANNAALTFTCGDTSFSITTIDAFGNAKSDDEEATIELGDRQIEEMLAFVMDQEEETQ